MPDQRPKATPLTKEKGRRQQILAMRCRMPGCRRRRQCRPLGRQNLDPDAPLHGRFLRRYRTVETVVEGSGEGQDPGRYRADMDPAVKTVEIVAFLHGMETSWLFDPSVPPTEVFR
jgi:hypothetical protein